MTQPREVGVPVPDDIAVVLERHAVVFGESFTINYPPKCGRCGDFIGRDSGPKDGWQLENGETVCHKCCAEDLTQIKAW